MIGQNHEAAIEQPLLAGEDRLNYGLEIIVNHALGHTAKERKGPVVRVEHQLPGSPGIGHDEHLAAECQPEMRDLDGLHDAVEFDMLMAPIELADLARRERQRDKSMRERWAGLGGFPALNETLNAVVGATISLGLQPLKQPARGAALGFRQQTLGSQPFLQRLLKRAELWRGLLFPAIDRFALGSAMFADRGAG